MGIHKSGAPHGYKPSPPQPESAGDAERLLAHSLAALVRLREIAEVGGLKDPELALEILAVLDDLDARVAGGKGPWSRQVGETTYYVRRGGEGLTTNAVALLDPEGKVALRQPLSTTRVLFDGDQLNIHLKIEQVAEFREEHKEPRNGKP